MAHRPLIGVTGPDRKLRWGWWATAIALLRAGARPVRLTARYPLASELELDAVVIGGGDDIDAALYGVDHIEPPDPLRDQFEMAMLAHARQRSLPVLGICRGAQLLNVVAGGNLHGDVRPLRHHGSNEYTPCPRKPVVLARDSRLGDVLKRRTLRVNSLHNQAVNRLGHGFRVVARDRDGIVQAIEREDEPLCIGVQWHPEYLSWRAADQRIFRALVRAARANQCR